MTEFTHEPVKRALEKLIQLSADEEVRRLAEVRERALHDWNSSINSARREGLQEGLEQGLEQGRIQALQMVLSRQLTRRFGPLSAEVAERIAAATPEQLEVWAENLPVTDNLEDLFNPTS